MVTTLTSGQRALLEERLELEKRELDRRIALRLGGAGRVEHAREVLLQDADDAPQREADRELDMAMADRDIALQGQVSRALARVQAPEFGLCSDCGTAIAFDRLRLEPWAERCVACETVRERARS
ncbi:MAG: TraR/DksA C4-type zinc finger protein [Aquincola sp.]|nr:TraR/DksA C4-type zinc finger protein [Aquincola sp.]MDH4287523.1 TraR/DksA C4-type zinc finger protein [Aquincola sp.]MDH5328879.1 TraR/DksA C4-type zinc finger protein [Aquincola sp.]